MEPSGASSQAVEMPKLDFNGLAERVDAMAGVNNGTAHVALPRQHQDDYAKPVRKSPQLRIARLSRLDNPTLVSLGFAEMTGKWASECSMWACRWECRRSRRGGCHTQSNTGEPNRAIRLAAPDSLLRRRTPICPWHCVACTRIMHHAHLTWVTDHSHGTRSG